MVAVSEGASPTGGSFLLTDVGSSRIHTPEGFTEEQRLYYRTALQFAERQVLPRAEQLERRDYALLRELLRQAGETGLLMIDVPEAHGGLGLDKTTSMLVAETQSVLGSWGVTFASHVGIGTLPIVWFGTDAQKQRYLPRLARGERVSAYALTETGSGSDALSAKTRAVLSPDGRHYLLTGQKQFISNAAIADVFIVFAKVDGEHFTAFIVDRDTPGLGVGREEHKMGVRGSSTCALLLEEARVPVENVLGEIGKGHKVAFNILNLGRLKLGAGSLGAMRLHLAGALRYAAERRQFGRPILQFPLIREKLAQMCALTYAIESMTYRTSGLMDARLVAEDRTAPDFDRKTIAAIEEFNVEASILKVAGTEALDLLLDEAVQIHGGYGFIEDFPVERAYRDQRVNRLFEGTNEINRMLITGTLLKRTLKGQLPLFDVAQAVADELASGALPKARGDDELSEEALTAEYLKRTAIYALKVATETYGMEIDSRQELLAAVSDIVIDAYAMDTLVSRTRQAATGGRLDPFRVAMVRLYALEAQWRAQARAHKVLTASARGQDLQEHRAKLSRLALHSTHDPVELRETVVARLEEAGGYPLPI